MDMSADESYAFSALLASAIGVDDPRDSGNDGVQQGHKRHLNTTPQERTEPGGEQATNTGNLGPRAREKDKGRVGATTATNLDPRTGRSAPNSATNVGQNSATTSSDEQSGRVLDGFGVDGVEAIRQLSESVNEWAVWSAERALTRHLGEDEGTQGLAFETLLPSASASTKPSHQCNHK